MLLHSFINLKQGYVGIFLQHAQESEAGVFLELGAAGGSVNCFASLSITTQIRMKGIWECYRKTVSRSASAFGRTLQGTFVLTNTILSSDCIAPDLLDTSEPLERFSNSTGETPPDVL